ncbi:transposase [Nocardioides sp. Root190]|uniref:transposase n=1 Tax=Nocardioides sp. Root190 TaxID=1736488 RepID=UPI0039E13BCE
MDVPYELHGDDATLGYRFLTDELDLEHVITVRENRVHRLCRIAGITTSHHKKRTKAGSTGPAPHDDRSPSSTNTVLSGTGSRPMDRTKCGTGTSQNTPRGKGDSTSVRSRSGLLQHAFGGASYVGTWIGIHAVSIDNPFSDDS